MIVWSDECTGAAGSRPDPAKWGLATTERWQPAEELQNYTTSTANACYDGQGHLRISAIKEPSGAKPYSSAKLMSRKASKPGLFRYGLIQARLSLPTGGGIWPAFWLLGEDNLGELAWPRCGEIDVMEAPVSERTRGQIHQGTHTPRSANAADDAAVGVDPMVGSWDGWHVYGVAWESEQLDFYIDHVHRGRVTRQHVEDWGGTWVFDHLPQSIVLNLAVGGWAGPPDQTWLRQDMLVDWVRVYA